jgi:hypothetical protein
MLSENSNDVIHWKLPNQDDVFCAYRVDDTDEFECEIEQDISGSSVTVRGRITKEQFERAFGKGYWLQIQPDPPAQSGGLPYRR